MLKNLEKAPTHIPGLDDILQGGLPRGRTTVINGGSGSGKTLLALEFLYRGALAGEPGIFIGFEEPLEHLRQNTATLGWDLPTLERENRLFLLDGRIKPETLMSGDFSLKGLLAIAAGKSKEMGAKRIVIDALEVILRLFDTPQQVRKELHAINDWLQAAGLAAILTVRPSSHGSASPYEDFFESMGDCILALDARVTEQISTRRLRVIKYRGSGFGRNEYPYVITPTGLRAAPISSVGLRHKPLGEKVSTGNARLDELLDGGYRRGACILLAGLPGAGKTTLAATFVAAACQRGERALYIGFEESEAALIHNVSSAGISLRSHLETGRLAFLTSFPESQGAEEHYFSALERVEAFRPDHVVIDAISACYRMGGQQIAFEYLMRLLNACKERGITIMLLNQLTGTTSYMEISGNEISSMVDTAILLNYQFSLGETNRVFQILKSRGGKHSNQKREFRLTDNGFEVTDVYLGEGDVLTGVARQRQEEKDRIEALRLSFEIKMKELELERLRLIQAQAAQGIAHRALMTGADVSPRPRPAPEDSGKEE
ncbi:MAG: circadian clock protein KaiC [Anaerolineae bacterium]